MSENRNMVLAIVLSAIVLFGWQYFIGMPKVAQQHKEAAQTQQQAQPQTPAAPGQPTVPSATPAAPQGSAAVPNSMTRKAALAASPRIAIDTPRIKGSIALKGARVDDVSLATYHETVDDKSPDIVLLSPAGGPEAFYAEFGWVSGDSNTKLPDADTVWTQEGSGALTPDHPITLSWDNGQGLVFKRTIAIDSQYMFTLSDAVENKGATPVSLHEYGIVSRHGIPHIQGYYVLHEGPVGVLGDGKLYEPSYKDIEKPMDAVKTTGGWLGITDKYWAAALIPDQSATMKGQFYARDAANGVKTYQAMFVRDPVTLAPGAQTSAKAQLFAGAKEVALIDGYEKNLDIKRFDLLIDWGWFYFITRPMFRAMDFFYRLFGNFGIAILLVTVLVKLLFFPLANKSYASMAKMKMVQPQMQALKEKYPDDKMKQQQELMELYKKEKINPVAGCLPIVIQIPVFFALYKVLFVTIEMRHAPFFGWIKDLSAPDPTNIFNLFGLIPIDPTALPMFGHFLHLGIWPLIMGCTMWAQMKMNPAPPDPTQKMIFAWMPVVFTFMLSSFSAGLVIYWAWNNFLSVLQQSVIMKKNGVKIELFDNLKSMFRKNPSPS